MVNSLPGHKILQKVQLRAKNLLDMEGIREKEKETAAKASAKEKEVGPMDVPNVEGILLMR